MFIKAYIRKFLVLSMLFVGIQTITGDSSSGSSSDTEIMDGEALRAFETMVATCSDYERKTQLNHPARYATLKELQSRYPHNGGTNPWINRSYIIGGTLITGYLLVNHTEKGKQLIKDFKAKTNALLQKSKSWLNV